MIVEILTGAAFIGLTGPLLLPKGTEVIKKAARLTREQMSASARSTKRPEIKGYRSQEDARRHRVDLDVGEIIYFPNSSQMVVDAGLKDTQSDGWWYAWNGREK